MLEDALYPGLMMIVLISPVFFGWGVYTLCEIMEDRHQQRLWNEIRHRWSEWYDEEGNAINLNEDETIN